MLVRLFVLVSVLVGVLPPMLVLVRVRLRGPVLLLAWVLEPVPG